MYICTVHIILLALAAATAALLSFIHAYSFSIIHIHTELLLYFAWIFFAVAVLYFILFLQFFFSFSGIVFCFWSIYGVCFRYSTLGLHFMYVNTWWRREYGTFSSSCFLLLCSIFLHIKMIQLFSVVFIVCMHIIMPVHKYYYTKSNMELRIHYHIRLNTISYMPQYRTHLNSINNNYYYYGLLLFI